MRYDPAKIEKKWQVKWDKTKIYQAEFPSPKKKFYTLVEFPYPSGEGLHVGHVKGQTAVDIFARFKRMQGYNVLNPMGWDAFGLPAENFAIKNKKHPAGFTEQNIKTFKRQIQSFYPSFDWSREINTTGPNYYKWTQWIFLQLFNKGLAYEKEAPINWCPKDKTGLANEEVINGRCERCETPVEKKLMRQWFLKITAYADRLLSDLDSLDWPEHIKTSQRNWIGKSEGALLKFKVTSDKRQVAEVEVFTTRPDTLFGATYMVLAPEHPLLTNNKLQITNYKEVEDYIKKAGKKSEIERTTETKEKTGVELKGVKAVNPANKEEIPIFVADYVLASYGTGAIMAVPAHDERDFEFAKKFYLPINQVVMPSRVDLSNPPQERKRDTLRNMILAILYDPRSKKYLTLKWKKLGWTAFVTGGVEDGEDHIKAAEREISEETGYTKVRFLRSLGATEAHFFAAHKNENRKSHAEHLLFELVGDSRANVSEEEKAQYEVTWLTLAELKAANLQHAEADIILEKLITGIDSYSGSGILINSGKFTGMESEKAKWEITNFVGGKRQTQYKLRDWLFSRQRYWGEPIPIVKCAKCGNVHVPEKELPLLLPNVKNYQPSGTGESPLADVKSWVNVRCPKCKGPAKRETNTMPQWAGSSWYFLRYTDAKNSKKLADPKNLKYFMPVDIYFGGAEHTTVHLLYSRFWNKALYDMGHIPFSEPYQRRVQHGLILGSDNRKMSKRWGNVINPDDVIKWYGADTMRTYIMFMGPYGDSIAWSTTAIEGISRFMRRIWALGEKTSKKTKPDEDTLRLAHQSIKKITDDIEQVSYHTAISQLMIFANHLGEKAVVPQDIWLTFLKLLAPFAPHIAEELWSQAKQKYSVHLSGWPSYDESLLFASEVELVVQVNGKVRGKIKVARGIDKENAEKQARADTKISKLLQSAPKRVIFVPDRLINFVA